MDTKPKARLRTKPKVKATTTPVSEPAAETVAAPEAPSITLDGTTYPLADLNDEVKHMIGLYQRWEAGLKTATAEVNKKKVELDEAGYTVALHDAALRSLVVEIRTRLKPTEPTPEPAPDPAP